MKDKFLDLKRYDYAERKVYRNKRNGQSNVLLSNRQMKGKKPKKVLVLWPR